MSTAEPTTLTTHQKAVIFGAVSAVLVLIFGAGLLLREYAPGNVGNGFLQGAAVGLLAAGVMFWRVWRAPEKATTFERAFTQSGDERDDALLTRALAVMGLGAFTLTGIAAIVIILGAHTAMVLFFLLVAQLLVGVIAYAVFSRRS